MALPGVRTILKDRFFTISRTDFPAGVKVLAIGRRTTANNTADTQGQQVPDFDPYLALNEQDVMTCFGKDSDLHRAYIELVAGGANNIYLVGMPSNTIDFHADPANHPEALNSTTTSLGGNYFQKAFDAAETQLPDIIVPWGRGSHPSDWDADLTQPATPSDYPLPPTQLGFYADNSPSAVDSMAKRVADAIATITDRSHPTFAVLGIKPFGVARQVSDGVTSNGSKTITSATANFSASDVGLNVTGTTIPVGATIATFNSSTSVDLSAPATAGGTSLVWRFTSIQNVTASQQSTHLKMPNLISRETGMGLTGYQLSIVAAEVKPVGYDPAWGYANGAATYAGFVAQLKGWSAPTSKVIFNVDGIRYNPTRVQSDGMSSGLSTGTFIHPGGTVPVALDFQRRPTWVDGVTFGKATSDYVRLSTLRIIYDAVMLVRGIAQSYIGEAATLEHRNSFETAITAGLKGMTEAGALIASNFVVTYKPRENKALVDMALTPAFELRNIDISVAVAF